MLNEIKPVELIKDEYLKRRLKNPHYSLVSFAKTLGISNSQLSRIIQGTRPLTYRLASRIAARLDLNEKQAEKFISQIVLQASDTAKVSRALRSKVANEAKRKSQREELSVTTYKIEKFKTISQWYHLAILEMTYLKGFDGSPEWIAARLGISPIEAKAAIERMHRLELIEKNSNGGFKKKDQHLKIETTRSEPEMREYHESMIKKAGNELQQTSQSDFNKRLIDSLTFPADPDKIPELKKLIAEFQQKILKTIKAHEFKEVYQFNFQLFPLTKTKPGAKS